ncbi:polysaccharide deacetylase family protein [Flavobacterium enshiense]|uniref:polysaccharide deacetylase family protein n=1 Tax=Flavobacterium enshiense TaxID=1341165 RepID=UPI00345C6C08
MSTRGTLVISLDFELIWGIFDHVSLDQKQHYFDNTLAVIPEILEQFSLRNVAATWATVGMLLNENWEEWEHNKPEILPTYSNTKLNPYLYGETHRKSGFDRFFFAPQLVKLITQTKGQELASHTYSHYYCLESGQTLQQFEADCKKAQEMGQKFDCKLTSLVFPRNQYNTAYLETCSNNGITTVRSNPSSWYWNVDGKETLPKKIFRTLDAYLPLGDKSYAIPSVSGHDVLAQPASRFLRPQGGNDFLNNLRLKRITDEIIAAAKSCQVYHLWWHPHNFGNDPKGSLQALKTILDTFIHCKESYGMESKTMQQLSQKQ